MAFSNSHSNGTKKGFVLGIQYFADLFECQKMPGNVKDLQKIMEEATLLINATMVKSVFHEYNPYGLSGVVVIAESHFAIHTWPEHGIASVDLFSCREIDPEKAFHFLEDQLQARDMIITSIDRGIKT